MHRSGIELINLYWEEVWNNGNLELIREICASPIVRHDANEVTSLTHDQQIARVGQRRLAQCVAGRGQQALADDRVGAQRQVGAVLLDRGQRPDGDRIAGRGVGELGPGQVRPAMDRPHVDASLRQVGGPSGETRRSAAWR